MSYPTSDQRGSLPHSALHPKSLHQYNLSLTFFFTRSPAAEFALWPTGPLPLSHPNLVGIWHSPRKVVVGACVQLCSGEDGLVSKFLALNHFLENDKE